MQTAIDVSAAGLVYFAFIVQTGHIAVLIDRLHRTYPQASVDTHPAQQRRLLALGTTCTLAAGALLGVQGCQEGGLPDVLPSPAPNCRQIDAVAIAQKQTELIRGVQTARPADAPRSRFPDAASQAVYERYWDKLMFEARSPAKISEVINEYTLTYHGFRTVIGAGKEPGDTRPDAINLLAALSESNPELIASAKIDTVYLNDPRPAEKSQKLGQNIIAFTNADPRIDEPRYVAIGPGFVADSFLHEINHQIRGRYVARMCTRPSLGEALEFFRANPPDFTYQDPPLKRPDVTFDPLKGSVFDPGGAQSVEEDVAMALEALESPYHFDERIILDKPILATKLAIAALYLNVVKPGLGDYYTKRYIAMSAAEL